MLQTPLDPVEAATEGSITLESLGKALEATQERVASIESRQADLQRALTAAREEKKLLERLLAIRQGEVDTDSPTEPLEVVPPSPAARGAKHPAVEEVVTILEQEERPLHISELMRLLHNRRVPLPGAGNQANVIARLRRDERVVRPARGMYGLRAWGLEEMPAPAKKTRRQRRRRVSGRSGQSTQEGMR